MIDLPVILLLVLVSIFLVFVALPLRLRGPNRVWWALLVALPVSLVAIAATYLIGIENEDNFIGLVSCVMLALFVVLVKRGLLRSQP